ncbi:MAG: ECF transporter S component [Spirochaetes bacterium]|nr:ECF transporter S component [Spirochaetota bacterium]MBU1079544.1 ECF transporter S component [Spirochaetota bacterium]
MERTNVRRVVVSGALGAVSAVMAITPLGYLPWFGGASLTIMHIPVIVAAVLEGPVAGTVVGLVFGVTSLLKAATAPVGPLDPLFANPLVSILPRLLIGLAAWAAYKLFRGKMTPLAAGFAGAVGSIVNTVLVLLALGLTASEQLSGAFGVEAGALPAILASLALSNGLVEAAAAAVFTSSVVSAWKGIEGARGRSRLAGEKG